MHVVRQQDLPFAGMSYHFIGRDHGVQVSAYLVTSAPGRRTRLHRHPYDEIVFVREGHGRWRVDDEERDAGPGDILVVKAGQVHRFTNTGDVALVQLDVHVSPEFIQEDLD